MAELDTKDIADIFVGKEIIFHMSEADAKPDQAKLVAALTKHKVKFEKKEKVTKDDKGTYVL